MTPGRAPPGSSTSISPDRESYFKAHDQALRPDFTAYGEKRPDGWHFCQYMRVKVLKLRES